MACALARPATYSNSFSGEQIHRQSISWKDYNWISTYPSQFPDVGTALRKDRNSEVVSESKGNICASDKNDMLPDSKHETRLQTWTQISNGSVKSSKKGVKRKVSECDFEEIMVPPKRISPFFNTPKERKEERRKILKISVQKIRLIEHADLSLRRSVLINNTMKKMKQELRKETSSKKRKHSLGYGMLSNDCLSESYLVDDPFLSGIHEKITDDMTDILMNNLENKLGARISCLPSAEDNLSDTSSSKPDVETRVNTSLEVEAMHCDPESETYSLTNKSNPSSSSEPADQRTIPEHAEINAVLGESTDSANNHNTVDKGENDTTATKYSDMNVPLNVNLNVMEDAHYSQSKHSERTRREQCFDNKCMQQ